MTLTSAILAALAALGLLAAQRPAPRPLRAKAPAPKGNSR
jgi:hypothetical protein